MQKVGGVCRQEQTDPKDAEMRQLLTGEMQVCGQMCKIGCGCGRSARCLLENPQKSASPAGFRTYNPLVTSQRKNPSISNVLSCLLRADRAFASPVGIR